MHNISTALDAMTRAVTASPRFWIAAGNLETLLLDMQEERVEKPIYVCGLARSGSTMLLETLASRPDVATHRYQDFPFLFTPYWWNTAISLMPGRDLSKHERAHGDRIQVNAESPEAMEEMLWMTFFPQLHGGTTEILDETDRQERFDHFYRDHIRKLLLTRKAKRYVSKGNYNVTRIGYLASLFPDARFIIPIREPGAHIASLMRQHRRFVESGGRDARVLRHMSAVGHFEFGLGRKPIHTGDTARYREILTAWQSGDEVRGWALLWDAVYGFVYDALEKNPVHKTQSLVVRYEDICANPETALQQVFTHADLPVDAASLKTLAAPYQAPDYPSPLSARDAALIREITGRTAQKFGY